MTTDNAGIPRMTPAQDFGFTRITLVLTGSSVSQVMPQWIDWTRAVLPQVGLRVVMRDSAHQFVTRSSVEKWLGARVQEDQWGDELVVAHVELAQWSELMIVYPATMNYLSKLAHGIADSPSLLAALCTEAVVCIAPSLPPRGRLSAAYDRNVALLRERPNYLVVDPVEGRSLSGGALPAWVPPPFNEVLIAADRHRRELEAPGARSPSTAPLPV